MAACVSACASFSKQTDGSVVGDVGSLSWVTTLLGILWPKLNASLAKLIHDKVTPQLQHALPHPFKGAHFSRFTLGDGVPYYGEVEVTQRSDTQVQIEVDVSLCTEADILLDLGVGGICFGVKRIRCSGRLCVALKPLMTELPLAGAVQIFFAAQPRIDMRFAGLAAVAEIPGLERKLYSLVEDLLRNSVVLPNSKTIQLAKDEQVPDWMEAYSHKPIGALRIKVLRARNLAGANWQMSMVDQFSSDPYCIVRLGTSSFRTATVRGSTNPEWPADDPAAYFPVYHHDQELEIEVRDEGRGGFLNTKFVSYLGKIKAQKVRSLLRPTAEGGRMEHRIELDTSQVNSSMLHVNDPVNRGVPSELDIVVEWANPSEFEHEEGADVETAREEVMPDDMLMLELHWGTGFPEESFEKGLRWRCSWSNSQEFPVTSMRGTPCKEEPDYENLPSDLRSNRKIREVIDRLVAREIPVHDIAAIVDIPAEAVLRYIQAKSDFERRVRARQHRDHNCMPVKWHQTLPLPPPRSTCASLVVELLEGERVVGTLDTHGFEEQMRAGQPTMHQPAKLVSASRWHGSGGGLAAWLFPQCGGGGGQGPVERGRFQGTTMEVSLRYQRFERGPFSRTVVGPPLQRAGSLSLRRDNTAELSRWSDVVSSADGRSAPPTAPPTPRLDARLGGVGLESLDRVAARVEAAGALREGADEDHEEEEPSVRPAPPPQRSDDERSADASAADEPAGEEAIEVLERPREDARSSASDEWPDETDAIPSEDPEAAVAKQEEVTKFQAEAPGHRRKTRQLLETRQRLAGA